MPGWLAGRARWKRTALVAMVAATRGQDRAMRAIPRATTEPGSQRAPKITTRIRDWRTQIQLARVSACRRAGPLRRPPRSSRRDSGGAVASVTGSACLIPSRLGSPYLVAVAARVAFEAVTGAPRKLGAANLAASSLGGKAVFDGSLRKLRSL